VGLDVHKDTIAVALACSDGSQVRYYGEIANTSKAIEQLIKKINPTDEVLGLCYETGPCGYGLYRQLTAMEHAVLLSLPR
jgi:transposase